MPNSSPIEPITENPVEDIFSDTPLIESAAPAESADEVTYVPTAAPSSGGGRRRLLIIATCVLALLLLGGGGVAIWLWLSNVPKPDTTIVQPNTNIVNTVPNVNVTNANDVVNVNAVPVNLNTNANTNTQSFVDVDHDGLSDAEELVENTNPKKKDTDEDGLSDREEVRVYGTDPRNPDTDSDGYADGDEVTHFYDPNNPDPKKRLFDLPQ